MFRRLWLPLCLSYWQSSWYGHQRTFHMHSSTWHVSIHNYIVLNLLIDSLHFLVSECNLVAEIQWVYIVLNVVNHGSPIMLNIYNWHVSWKKINWRMVQFSPSGTFHPKSFESLMLSPIIKSKNEKQTFFLLVSSSPNIDAWCISFLGIHPTLTHVPPRPELETWLTKTTR